MICKCCDIPTAPVVSHAQIHKYKCTNTQIQHMTKCQKDPTCGIFLKRGLFKDMKMIFPCVKRTNTKIQIHKYTNIAYDKVPERPSILTPRISDSYSYYCSYYCSVTEKTG